MAKDKPGTGAVGPASSSHSRLGSRLRAARERKDASLEVASREAAVPLRYLRMLEEGRFPTVADPAYLTHFLRRYAGWLGLDPEVAIRDLLEETEPETTARRTGRKPPENATLEGGRRRRLRSLPPGWAVYVAVLLAGGGLVVAVMRQQREQPESLPEIRLAEKSVSDQQIPVDPEAPAVVPAQPERAAPLAQEETLPAAPPRAEVAGAEPVPESPASPLAEARPSSDGASAASGFAADVPAPAPALNQPAAPANESPPSDPSAPEMPAAVVPPAAPADAAPPAPEPAPAPAEVASAPAAAASPAAQDAPAPPFELRVTATSRQVWVWISVDGGARGAVSLKQGESASWVAQRGFVLSTDDAGGIRASLNGEELPSFGAAAQARRNVVIPPGATGARRG